MDQKRKYVYVGGFELPDKNAAAHRVISIGKLLRSCKQDVIFVGVDKNSDVSANVLDTQTSHDGFCCFSVKYPYHYTDWLWYLCNPKKYIEVIKYINKVDGVIFYNFPAISMKILMSYCRKHGIKIYADVTEWYSAKDHGVLKGLLKKIDTNYRMWILHNRMDGMIVISQYLKEFYQKRPNICRIPILEDTSNSKWKNNYSKSTTVLELVYAGWPRKKDRIDYLIESLKLVKRDCHLTIVGITQDAYLDIYPHHKTWLKDNDKIHFAGRVTHQETLEYIKKANYSCFFRLDERSSNAGFPTKFVEAVCCGTPVITNTTSDLGRYITEGKNGILIDRLDMGNIARAIDDAPQIMSTDGKIFDYRKYRPCIKKVFDI